MTLSDADLITAVLLNNVVIHTSSAGVGNGDITITEGSNIQYDSPNSLSFFANRNIFVNGDIKNHGTTDTAFAGTGHITLVAGWDGTGAGAFVATPGGAGPSVDAASILAGTYGDYGTNNGSVFLNDAALEPVEVGSARGETNAFGNVVLLTAGNGGGEFTQLGYRRENDTRGLAISGLGGDGMIGTPDDVLIRTGFDLDFDNGVTGNINVYGKSGVFLLQHPDASVDEGVKNVDRTYVMIGHGGMRENDDDVERRANVPNSALGFTSAAASDYSAVAGTSDFGSDSGNTTVGNGDNHGNITVVSQGAVLMQAARAEGFAQIGHGGLANDDPDYDPGDAITDPVNGVGSDGRGFYAVSDRGLLSDNNTRSLHVFGNMTGDIKVTASTVDMEGGRYNDAYVMIGHGGTRIRGEHTGDIEITTTSGGIRARAAPDSASGGPANSNDWRWQNNRDQSFAQIGHGGFDSDFLFLNTLGNNPTAASTDPYDTTGNVDRPDDPNGIFMDANPNRTTILNNSAGLTSIANTSHAGDGIAINRVRGTYSDTAAYTVNGVAGGVTNEAFGHSGDITINSAGDVEFVASNGTDAYAMVGHGGRSTIGDHKGDITVNSGGDIIFTREAYNVNERGRDISVRGDRAHVQIGHGGTRFVGGATGDISVDAAGSVEFYGGRSESYAMIGHGGRGEDGSTWNGGRQRNGFANGTLSGDITVTAGSDIKFRSGFTDTQAHSMIGHGGYYLFADVLETNDPNRLGETPFGGGASAADQVGHNGDIVVTAGGDISFIAGQTETLLGQDYMEKNGGDNYTMIGHGGRNSKGDHWGNITVTSGGDLNLEARGGWDAVTIENIGASSNDLTGTPRLNSTEDFGRTGYRNFAQIGHGGFDAEHVNTNNTQNWNNSGVNGDGIGTAGPSDIVLNVGGNLTALAAMKATTGDKPMPKLAYLVSHWDTNSATAGTQLNVMLDAQTQYVDAFGNSVTIGQDYSQYSGRLERALILGVSDPDGDDGNDDGDVAALTFNIRADGEDWIMPDPMYSAEDSYVQIGNGGRATDYRGSGGARTGGGTGAGTSELIVDGLGFRGDITINVGGDIRLEASDIKQAVATNQGVEIAVLNFQGNAANAAQRDNGDTTGAYIVGPLSGPNADAINGDDSQNDPSAGTRNYAMIGLGGHTSRGDHNGAITINAGGNLDVIAGEGREAFAQIGSGGFDSDRENSDNNRGGDIGMTTDINIDIGGKLTMKGGGLQDGDTTGVQASLDAGTGDLVNPLDPAVELINVDDDRGSYVQIGSGGASTGGNHHADINIITGTGAELEAGPSNRQSGYGMVGSGSTWGRSELLSGDISLIARTGDITIKAATPVIDSLDDPNAGPANPGNVLTARESYFQIGNGGWDTDAQGGNQNNVAGDGSGFTGNITVIAAEGSIVIAGGGSDTLNNTRAVANTANDSGGNGSDHGRGLYAKIGNGGAHNGGDASGNILVSAGTDLTITGGRGGEIAYAQIGHGGNDDSGNYSGTIDVNVGRDLIMQYGSRADAKGDLVRDAYAKIGHGSTIVDGGGQGDGTHPREGNITVSVGRDLLTLNGLNADGADNGWGPEIGHVNLLRDLSVPVTVGTPGDTLIAVSRNNPTGTGGGDVGSMTVSTGTSFSSADRGFLTELRLYMPSAAQDLISDGAYLNGSAYSRTDFGGVGNRSGIDEQLGTEHTLIAGATYGEPTGDFGTPPEGDYPFHALGFYNIYFASDTPVTPVTPTGPGVTTPTLVTVEVEQLEDLVVLPVFNYFPYLDVDKFDSYDRDDMGMFGDFLFGLFSIFGLAANEESDAANDDGIRVDGDEILQEPSGLFGLGPAQTEEEQEEEENKSGRYLKMNHTMYGSYWVYDITTGKYSSLREFGVPAVDVTP